MIYPADIEKLTEHEVNASFSLCSADLGSLMLCMAAEGPSSAVDLVKLAGEHSDASGEPHDIGPDIAKRLYRKAHDYELLEKQGRKFVLTDRGETAASLAYLIIKGASTHDVVPSKVFGQSRRLHDVGSSQRFEGPLSRALLLALLDDMVDADNQPTSDDVYKNQSIQMLGLEETTLEAYLRLFERDDVLSVTRTKRSPDDTATVNSFSIEPRYALFSRILSSFITSGVYLPRFSSQRKKGLARASKLTQDETLVKSALERHALYSQGSTRMEASELRLIIQQLQEDGMTITPTAVNAHIGNTHSVGHLSRMMKSL